MNSLFEEDPFAAESLRQYVLPGAGYEGYDEMCEGDNTFRLRPAWAEFSRWLADRPLSEALSKRQEAITKQILNNGITYNVYSDQQGTPSRPWSLDLLPLLISSEDWATIEAGATERAHLLNGLMEDIYGPQTLLKKGLLPPALVFGNPGFLRPMVGFTPRDNVWLHLIAFDLARAPNGRWWVVGHRIQAPSGLGYVLENRLTIARAFSEGFRELRVQHIAAFYRRYLDALHRLSPAGSGARVALLTPGPYNETYFEHAYLARYLGISLVESHDLVVRQRQLFLKTVHGMERIHVLIRRVDDDWMDRLELRPESHLGVPGLLQAIRAGEVLVANTPGGGWLESPALHGFLPGISREWLGKNLSIPSVPSWWCGEAAAWAQVSERLNTLVIKPTCPGLLGSSFEPIMGSLLNEEEQSGWRSSISTHPDAYTLQELLPLSQVPVWRDGEFSRRPLMVRVFAASDGKGSYNILPGGLTRIAGSGSLVVSMQRGGSSLDTWILSENSPDRTTLLTGHLKASEVKALRRPVSSSAAEHLYWLGRYSERSEVSLRLLSRTLKLLREEDQIDQTIMDFLVDLTESQGLFDRPDDPFDLNEDMLEQALLNALNDVSGEETSTYSLGFNVAQLSRVAGHIRDRLSTEHWRWVTECQSILHQPNQLIDRDNVLDRLSRARLLLAAISGEQSDHMTRDDGWRFLTVGRQIERLIGMCDALLVLLEHPNRTTELDLEFLVGLADSVITYRARYQHRFEWLPVLDLLVFDDSNPRSIRRIIYKVNQGMEKLPGDPNPLREGFRRHSPIPPELTLESLQPPYSIETVKLLKTWLREIKEQAGELSRRVSSHYFRLADQQDILT